MIMNAKDMDPEKNIGIFVELKAGTDEKFHYKIDLISVYRVQLVISLPQGKQNTWASGTWKILKKVEAGTTWPIRFDYCNLTRFISIEALENIEKALPGITVYVYRVPSKERTSSFDEDTLRRWFNAAQRTAYVSGSRAERKSAAMDGQLALDLA